MEEQKLVCFTKDELLKPREIIIEITNLMIERGLTDYSGGNMALKVGQKIYITQTESAEKFRWKNYRHFGVGKCYICRRKGTHKRYFAPVNPTTGGSYNDTFINPKTGNINHSWPRRGRWVLVCDECKPNAIGIRISAEGAR